MHALLPDLYGHQAWADAEHWRAIAAHPPARDDLAIRNRLHHIAIVQRGFLWIAGGRQGPFAFTTAAEFTALEDLKEYSRDYHDRIGAFMASVEDARLSERVEIPWFKDPPLTLTLEQALTQCAMHSHYHRGQNATRLRELGGEPPLVDLIVWYWQERPAPRWSV